MAPPNQPRDMYGPSGASGGGSRPLTGYPGGYPGFPPPPPPPRRRRNPALLIIAGVVGVVVLGGLGITLAANQDRWGGVISEPSPTGAWQVGQCVSPAVPSSSANDARTAYERVACSDRRAGAKIHRVVAKAAPVVGSLPCPQDSDAAISDPFQTKTICVRNLQAPHPGDPGGGGGVIRTGDCINESIALSREVACASDNAWGKIIAVTGKASDCDPSRTDERVDLDKGRTACVQRL
jgi:hypothetical protein